MNEPTHEIEAYLSGEATAEQLRAVEAWIQADPANAKAFVQQLQFRELVGERMRERGNDATLVLAELAQLEASAETITLPIDQDVQNSRDENEASAGSISAHDLAIAGRYVLRRALTSKAAVYAYAAAVVLLVGALLVPWGGSEDPTPAPIADDKPGQPADVIRVATLTAQHDAQWASDAPSTGDALASGQRLTLTQGFAEITTARGAVAILEAPATIELIDSPNALRLHSGKIVGICETDSSKGFLVRTPHMEITDLGTRFGVEATRDGTTEVHVFDGEVQTVSTNVDTDAAPTRLSAGQSASASANTATITAIEYNTDRFAALLPTKIQLPGTGQGLNVGDTDPNWQIVAIDGKPLDTPQLLRVASNGLYNKHFANDPATSQWLAWNPLEQTGDEHTYLIRTTVQLPESDQQNNARLVMQYMADNELRAVIINGNRVELPRVDITDMFTMFHEAELTEHLMPGQNTLVFELVNVRIGGGLGEAGLRIGMRLDTPTTPPPGTTR